MGETWRLILLDDQGNPVNGVELIVAKPIERIRALPFSASELRELDRVDWD